MARRRRASSSSSSSSSGSGDEEPEKTYETCPVFHPTLEEMKNFSAYMLKIHRSGASSHGICKIVPPASWRWSPNLPAAMKLRVQSPIQQCIQGRAGTYSVCNIVRPDLTVQEFRDKATKLDRAKGFACEDPPEEIERRFWRSLTTTADAPFYGADVVGSIFGDANVEFNINSLDCMLKRSGIHLPGITSGMLYCGAWRSFFAFHTEDVHLMSINYVHCGAPKFWYGLPPSSAVRLESLAKSIWPHETCKEFMRHKTKLVSPSRLAAAGIPFVRGVQKAGEFMVTWPAAYHAGFNSGFNLAEAVNFVPPDLADVYLETAKTSSVCKCRPDSVTLNLDWLEGVFKEVARSKRMTGPASFSVLKGRVMQEDPKTQTREGKGFSLAKPPSLGQVVEMLSQDDEWTEMIVVDVMEGHVRLHVPGGKKQEDVWVQVNSKELRRPPELVVKKEDAQEDVENGRRKRPAAKALFSKPNNLVQASGLKRMRAGG